jgi:hypothetical protein
VDGVLPLVPDLFDFAAGLASIVRPNGIVSITVPHVLQLLQYLQFDAFRHDVRTYLSLRVLERLLCSVGLRVFDAERISEEGGKLRVHACPAAARFSARPSLKTVRTAEAMAELENPGLYANFAARVQATREQIRDFVSLRQAAGRSVMAYGVNPRASMLLNACGLDHRHIVAATDTGTVAVRHCLPGSRIPIVPLQTVHDVAPDDLLILPWVHAHEISGALQPLRHYGTQVWSLLPRIMRV